MLFSRLFEKFLKRGTEEPSAEDKELWADWNERRMAAKDAGKPFDEPAPAPGRRRGKGRRRGRPTAADAAAGAFLVGPPVDHHFGGHDGGGGYGGGGDAGGGF